MKGPIERKRSPRPDHIKPPFPNIVLGQRKQLLDLGNDLVMRLGIELNGVDMAEGPIVEIEHTKGNDMPLVPSGSGVQELGKSKSIGADGVRLALLNGREPSVSGDVWSGDVAMQPGHGSWRMC